MKIATFKPSLIACLIVLLAAALPYGDNGEPKVAPRTQFKIPLAKIAVTFNNSTNKYDQVRINFDDAEAYIIAPGDDMLSKKGGESTTYRELQQNSYQLSDFEAKTISRVCRTLISALEEYETILKNEAWGKALYLDSYFPRFLRGFHVMMCAAKESPEALPRAALVSEDEYDNSENSPKSDARIKMWRTEQDRIMKLRIASKELASQIKLWQKNELNDPKRDPEISASGNFERTFTAFVKNYFGYAK